MRAATHLLGEVAQVAKDVIEFLGNVFVLQLAALGSFGEVAQHVFEAVLA